MTRNQLLEILSKYIHPWEDINGKPIVVGLDRAIIELECQGLIEFDEDKDK